MFAYKYCNQFRQNRLHIPEITPSISAANQNYINLSSGE